MRGPHSEETKRKISEGRKGIPCSEEAKRRTIEAHKGIPRSEETKRKMSEGRKGIGLGKKLSEEHKQKIGQAQKGRVISEEHRQKIAETNRGKKRSEETRRKQSEAKKLAWQKPEIRESYLRGAEERWVRPEEHIKTSLTTKAAMKEVMASPEYKQNLENAMKITRATPEYQEALAKGLAKAHRYRGRTSIEVIVASMLTSLEVEYEEQKRIGRYIVDFYVPAKNLVVECDGTYWHSDRKAGAKEKDARKDSFLTSKEYSILRLPESDIKKGNFSSLIQALF